MIYFLVGFFLICASIRFDICGREKGRNELYFFAMIVLILLAGLRWRVGGDTTRYLLRFYYETPPLYDLSWEDLQIGNSPFWKLLTSFVYTIGGKFFWVQIVESAFVNILFFKYIKRHCSCIFTCVFLYFIAQYLLITTEVMRAGFAIAICLYVNDYMLERKWLKAYFLIGIAVLFHPQAIIVALTPLFISFKINKYTLSLLVLSYFVGYLIQVSIGEYLDLLEYMEGGAVADKITAYGNNSDYNDSRSIIWQIINVYPLILYSIVGAFFFKLYPKDKSLKLQPFFIIGLLYQIMSLQVYIIYRIADMYKIYIIIYISCMIISITKDNRFIRRDILLFRSFIISLPLVVSLLFNTMIAKNRVKYFPYTSIFNREIIKNRELHVHAEEYSYYSIANKKQY